MTTQYTTILKLALPVQGELSGTWGDVVNNNITSMVEEAVAGRKVINTWTANSHTLTSADGTTSESRAAILTLTDTGTALTGAGTVVCPALSKVYIVENSTAQVITIKTSGGTGIAVPVGRNMVVFCDGTNVEEGISNIASLSIGGDGATVTGIKDEDNMSSNSATKLATQQSIKAYVDSQVGANNELSEVLANGNTSGANDIIVDNGQKITVNTIDETTAGSGVAIDSVLLKDDGVNATNLEVTNIKANDGTAAGSIADSTGVVTVASAVLTTADINGGTADGVVIGGTTPAAATVTTATANTSLNIAGTVTVTSILDEDNMASDDPAGLATQQSIKAYVDSQVGANNELSEVLANGNTTGGTDIAVGTGDDITFADSSKAIFGAGSDLQIYHDGSNSYVADSGTGRLFLSSDGDGVNIVTSTGENLIRTDNDGQVRVYFDNSEKIRTNATGIDVTGVITTDGMTTSADINFGDNDKAIFGDGSDLQIYHDGSNSIITDQGSGTLKIQGDSAVRLESTAGERYFVGTNNGAARLYHDDSAKLATTSTGIDVTGTALTDGLTVDGDVSVVSALPRIILEENDATDLNTAIRNNGGVFKIQTVNDAANSFTSRMDIDHSTGAVTFATGSDIITASAGTSNVRVGVNAGNSITSGGDYNVAVGDEAGTALTTGDYNIAIGYEALSTEDTGGRSIAIGYRSLKNQNNDTTNYNVAVGYAAGLTITTGVKNVLIGGLAGDALTEADQNVAVGNLALSADTLGSHSVAVGNNALRRQNFTADTDTYNVAVGDDAGTQVTTGIRNTLIGALAGDALTDTDNNVAIGYSALGSDTLGINSVAIGFQALLNQNFTTATDSHNVAIGVNAGKEITTATQNTLLGNFSGDALTTGSQNVAIGHLALSKETTSANNVAIGREALKTQNGAANNTVIGRAAGALLTTGANNAFVGSGAAGNGTVTGNANNCIGMNSLYSLTSGASNSALGDSAGLNITTGSNNTALGHDALRSGSPGGPAIADSNVFGLGDENVASLHCQVSLTVSSDQRDKTDFVDLDLGLDFVKGLEPVTYYWDKRAKYLNRNNEDGTPNEDYDLDTATPDGTHKEDWMDVGFKAQSVQALEEAAGYTSAAKKNLTVSVNADGKQLGLKYEKFIPILVKAIQDQDEIITALTARIEALEA